MGYEAKAREILKSMTLSEKLTNEFRTYKQGKFK